MTALRQKLLDELDLRGLAHNAKDHYVGAVYRLARHFKKSPDLITDDELKQYLLHLIRDQRHSHSTLNVTISAFRFFYGQVFQRSMEAVEQALPRQRKQTIRPRIYRPEEIERLLSVEGPTCNWMRPQVGAAPLKSHRHQPSSTAHRFTNSQLAHGSPQAGLSAPTVERPR